jgi:hypothetical protein
MNDGPLLSSDHWNAYRARLHHCHTEGGISYITKRAISFNEGGHPFNFHINWGGTVRGFYVYLYGKRLYWFSKVKH